MDAFLLSVVQNGDTLHAKDTTFQQYLLYWERTTDKDIMKRIYTTRKEL